MQGSTGGEDEDGGVMWTTIGGQMYAVPVKRKKSAAPAQSAGEPTAPDQTKASVSPKAEPKAASGVQSSTGGGGWGWLGFGNLTKDVPALNAGLGLAESTLSGLYNAVSSSAAYIVQPLADDEPVALPSEQEKKELAITTDLVDFVQNVTDHPSTFTNFPVETAKGPQPAKLVHEGVYTLSPKQTKHVTAMLALVPKLQKLRHDLVPAQLDEDIFWQVYFSLIERKTDSVDWERDQMEQTQKAEEEAEEGVADERSDEEEVDENEAEKRRRVLASKAQYRREMVLGNDEDDDDQDHAHSKPAHVTLLELRSVWNAHKSGYMNTAKAGPVYEQDSARLEKLWEEMVFSGKEPGRLIREQFGHLIRQGIAPTHRTMLWPLMADALALTRRSPTLYEEALQRVYITHEGKQELAAQEAEAKRDKSAESDEGKPGSGDGSLARETRATEPEASSTAPGAGAVRILPSLEVPTAFSRVPNYGGKLISISHWLDAEGTAAAKRLLTVFAICNPEWDYAPCLPDLVLLLLHYLPEPTVYFVLVSMLGKNIQATTQRQVNRSKRDVETTLCTLVDCLLAQHLPRVHSHLNGRCRDVMISRDFQKEMQQWLERLFVGVLPQQTVFKVVDNLLAEGVLVLYQTALRILKANEEDLLQANDGHEFMARLRAIAQRYLEQGVDDAFLFSSGTASLFAELAPGQVQLAEAKAKEANPQLDSLTDPALSISHLPTVKQSSQVISQEQFEVIWQWLPSRYRVKNPVRHFSSAKDGFSILSIYRQCHKSAPHVFLVKTKQGKIFGAYLTDGWKQAQKFYGSGECFLFTIHPLLRKFGWTTANKDLFMIGHEKDIMIGGGGGSGIWLDSELWHGTSEYCETFRNDPLNGSSKFFEAVAVEIYGFS